MLVGGYHYVLFPLLVICESVYMASVLVSRCEYVLHGRVHCMKVCVWVGVCWLSCALQPVGKREYSESKP